MWLGLHWHRARAAPLLCGMLVGVATLVSLLLAARSFTPLVHGVHPGVLGLGSNLVTVYLATLVGRWRKRRRAAQHGSKLADEPTPSLVITPPLADEPTAATAAATSPTATSPTAASSAATSPTAASPTAAATAAATTRTADGATLSGGPPFASVEEELFASQPPREPARAWCGLPWVGAAVLTLASSTFWRQGGEQDAVLWVLPRWADLSNAATLLLGMGACVATYYGWEVVAATDEERGPRPGQAAGCCRRRLTRTAPAAPAAPAVAVELVGGASGRSAEGADEWQAI